MKRRQIVLVVIVLVAAALLGIWYALNPMPALANEPPVPEPPAEWDKSSIVLDAACVKGTPSFTVLNHGAGMTGPTSWYLLDVAGGAADCAADVAAGYLETGVIQLAAEESVTLTFEPIDPPQRLCVQQRPLHPGEGWASATITEESVKVCVTAEDVVGEPGRLRWLFVPWVGRE